MYIVVTINHTQKIYLEELLPIVKIYDGDNNFVNNIKTQLLKYRKLSEKQIDAAMRQN